VLGEGFETFKGFIGLGHKGTLSATVCACMYFVCKDKKSSAKTLSDAIRARGSKPTPYA
jgi:hypothetical protein